jgi:predicted MFS family arabinose efflux permease
MGVIIAQYSVTAAYFLSVTLYSCAILCMFGVKRSRSSDADSVTKPLMQDITQGFSYIRTNRPVLICLLFGLIPMFIAMPFQNLLVMLAEQAWQVGESGVGTLMAVGGIGGVLGAVWIIRRGDKSQRLHLMLASTAAFGVCLAVFVYTSNFYLALLPLLIANMCMSASQTVNNAAVQLLVEDKMRGRMSSFMMLSFGLTPIGVFPMAIAADRIGAANAIFAACILLVLCVAIFYFLSSTLRNLDNAVEAAAKKVSEQAG